MNNYYLLISWVSFILCAWEQELTTEVIQKYHAPNSLIRTLSDIKTNKVIKYENYYIKPDVSRIVGVERLKAEFAHSRYDNFRTAEKFLVPFFDKNGKLDFKKSFIVSHLVDADYLKMVTDDLVIQLLRLASKTEVYDFAQRNMLQDTEKNIWFIDTQLLYKTDYVAAAAEALLDSHQNFLPDGYLFSNASQKKLLEYVSSPISQRRFKDLPTGMPPSDYV